MQCFQITKGRQFQSLLSEVKDDCLKNNLKIVDLHNVTESPNIHKVRAHLHMTKNLPTTIRRIFDEEFFFIQDFFKI